MIQEIYIRNFRSIESLHLDCSNINTFIGRNDAGKSNVMKALNLFFKGYTDPGELFNFDRDFCEFHNTPEKKAKEIIIDITFYIPTSYGTPDRKQLVVWRKVWRRGGVHEPGGYIKYKVGNRRQDLARRSKIPHFLRTSVDFHYVPAIKDRFYFSSLLGELYDALAESSKEAIEKSTNEFESAIGKQTKNLSRKLGQAFKKESAIKLPEDFRKIFEDLDFSLDGIPLNRMGDGVKVRHIPEILNFIAELTDNALQINVWAFEEPENCLEIKACQKLSSYLANRAKNGYQIFLTTHSPVFYTVGKEFIRNKSYFVYKNTRSRNKKSREITLREEIPSTFEIKKRMEDITAEEIDEGQNAEDFLEKSMEVEKNIIMELEKHKSEIKKLKSELKRREKNKVIFTEGKNDSIVIRKILDSSYPATISNQIQVIPKVDSKKGTGASQIPNLLGLWLSHINDNINAKAYAIFDDDKAGRNGFDEVEKIKKQNANIGSCKLSNKRAISDIKNIITNINVVNTDLEAMYSDSIWGEAESKKWIKLMPAKKVYSRIPDSNDIEVLLFQAEIKSGKKSSHCKNGETLRRITFEWTDDGKKNVANHINNLSDTEAQDALKEFDSIIKGIIKFFGL